MACMGYRGASNEKILHFRLGFSHDFMKEEFFRSIMGCSPMLWSLGCCKEEGPPPLAVKHNTMKKKGKSLWILKRLYNFFITFPKCSGRLRQKYASSIRMNKPLPLQTENKYLQSNQALWGTMVQALPPFPGFLLSPGMSEPSSTIL